MSKGVSLTLVFSTLLGLTHLLTDIPSWAAADLLLLPNVFFLYVFAWTPIPVYVAGRLWSASLPQSVKLPMVGVLYLSSLTYLVVGIAQLIRFFVLPFGILTITMSVLFFRQARKIEYECKAEAGRFSILQKTASVVILVLCSTILDQPSGLVFNRHVEGANFVNADLSDLFLARRTFERVDFSGANFAGTELSGSEFTLANLSKSIFYNTKLSGVKISKSNLSDVTISNSYLYQSSIADSNLIDALINASYIGRVDLTDSKLCGAKFLALPYPRGIYNWNGSIYNGVTVLPPGVQPENEQMVYADLRCRVRDSGS
ncbi:MAG: pentapeptide repeat-containing protein [Pseudomonadota bacterium]